MDGASDYITGRISDYFSSAILADSSLTPRFAVGTPQQPDWTSCSAQLADLCLSPATIRRPSKRASQKEQILAWRCWKCQAVIVRCAGLPCTLMTVTLSVCVMLGEIPRWRCAQWDWLLSLRLSMLPDSFLFRKRLRPSHFLFSSSQGLVRNKQRIPDLALCATKATAQAIVAVNVQHGSFGTPPLAHDDGAERGGQGSLPRRSSLVKQPFRTSCGGLCGMLYGGSEVVSSDATLPPETHQLFCCFQSPQTCANSAAS